jgi:hypothetical protein
MDAETPDRRLLLEAWEKHENIAMHFNDLILRIRTQALGALAAVITVGSVLLRQIPPEQKFPWTLLAVVLAALLFSWVAIWLLHFLYYNRLLMGAIDSILALEDAINKDGKIELNMSHKIEDSVAHEPPTHRRNRVLRGPASFYGIITFLLGAGALCCALKALRPG